MEITCPSCSKKMNIPDEKIPQGQAFSFGCPSCKTKIKVNPDGTVGQSASGAGQEVSAPVGQSFGADADKPGAMVCHTDPVKYKGVLESLGYAVHTPGYHEEGLNNLRLNNYSMVLVTDDFEGLPHDQGSILTHLREMPMVSRRKIFVVYIAKGAHSYNDLEAFSNSVNLIASPEDAAKDNLGDHLSKAVSANDAMYKVFFECMAALGKS